MLSLLFLMLLGDMKGVVHHSNACDKESADLVNNINNNNKTITSD